MLLVKQSAVSKYDSEHRDHQEHRTNIEYGTTLWTTKSSSLSGIPNLEEYFIANIDELPIWSVGCLMQDHSKPGDFYLFTVIHPLKTLANMNLKEHGAYNFKGLQFFVRYNCDGKPRFIKLSNKAFGFFGISTHGNSAAVDALVIKIDDVISITGLCEFASIGLKPIHDARFESAFSVQSKTAVYKQSRNFLQVQSGLVFKPRKSLSRKTRLFGNTMLAVSGLEYRGGCSGSLVYSRGSDGTFQLYAFVHSGVETPQSGAANLKEYLRAVDARSCIDVINRQFSLDLNLHHRNDFRAYECTDTDTTGMNDYLAEHDG